MSLALTGYGLSLITFAMLGGLCITSWRGRAVGALLSLACGLTALWSGTLAASVAGFPGAAAHDRSEGVHQQLTATVLVLQDVSEQKRWIAVKLRVMRLLSA